MTRLEYALSRLESLYRAEYHKNPSAYHFGPEGLQKAVTAIRIAFAQNRYSKEGPAVKALFKELGLKHTYKAMQEWLASPKPVEVR